MTTKLLQVIFISAFMLTSLTASAQQKHRQGLFGGLPDELAINGYIDTYIAYDNDRNSSPRQFSAIAPYRDEFRLNLAMIALRYSTNRVRGNVAVQFGDIPKLNWPQAPNEYLQFIQEANLGFSPCKNFWIDGGYFLTHIGGEGVIPKDNFFQSFSLCTYFEPLYQSGVKFSYTGKKFYGTLFLLNGFNVLADNNKNKSVGLQLRFKPNSKVEFTYNNIIGNEMPSGVEGKTRIYNNLVVKLAPAKKLDIILCGDYCTQEKSKLSDPQSSASLFSGFLSIRYRVVKKFSAALRGETFNDNDAILSQLAQPEPGLKANGITFGIEYNPQDNAYFRLETRYLNTASDQKIFYDSKNSRVEVILSGGIGF